MTRADVFAGLLLAAGFSAALWEASSFQYGTEFAPGPGFAPIWLSAIGIALSLLLALNAFKAARHPEHSTDEDRGARDKAGFFRVGATLAGLAAMLAIAPWLGLVPSILVFLLFLTLYVQRLSLVTGIGASVATVFFVYVVFVRLLDVPIPSGPLGF